MTFLKQHGISFTQAVNNTCACTPSRTTIFTGTYPTKNLSNFTRTEFYQPTNMTATPYNIPEENNTNVPTAGPYPLALSYTENQLDQTLLAGNNGPILFQAQPTLPSQPQYRVARTSAKGAVTYEDVVWENYTSA